MKNNTLDPWYKSLLSLLVSEEQIGRTPFELPTVHVRDGIESFMDGDIILENYQSHPSIKAPLSN
jgi:thymidylate synthase